MEISLVFINFALKTQKIEICLDSYPLLYLYKLQPLTVLSSWAKMTSSRTPSSYIILFAWSSIIDIYNIPSLLQMVESVRLYLNSFPGWK